LSAAPGRLIAAGRWRRHDDALARRLATSTLACCRANPAALVRGGIVDRDGNFCDLLTTNRSTATVTDMVVTVSLDITARKRAELDLLAIKDQAEIANRSKTEFLANMSMSCVRR